MQLESYSLINVFGVVKSGVGINVIIRKPLIAETNYFDLGMI